MWSFFVTCRVTHFRERQTLGGESVFLFCVRFVSRFSSRSPSCGAVQGMCESPVEASSAPGKSVPAPGPAPEMKCAGPKLNEYLEGGDLGYVLSGGSCCDVILLCPGGILCPCWGSGFKHGGGVFTHLSCLRDFSKYLLSIKPSFTLLKALSESDFLCCRSIIVLCHHFLPHVPAAPPPTTYSQRHRCSPRKTYHSTIEETADNSLGGIRLPHVPNAAALPAGHPPASLECREIAQGERPRADLNQTAGRMALRLVIPRQYHEGYRRQDGSHPIEVAVQYAFVFILEKTEESASDKIVVLGRTRATLYLNKSDQC